jgi:ribosome-associated translation inhibitor RaiA
VNPAGNFGDVLIARATPARNAAPGHQQQAYDMQTPLEVTFRNMDRSAALEARATELAAQLERFRADIIRCHVTVETPHRHQRQGKHFEVKVRITVPGTEIVVCHHQPQDPAHEDPYVALNGAFRAAQRQLEGHARIRRGDVKSHDRTAIPAT